MSVIFLPEVRIHFKKIIPILYEKGYFGFKETAVKYVDNLFDDIEINLPACLHKIAPKHFEKYGKDMYYSGFRKNKNTIWYAFFTKYEKNKEIVYLVRHIENNHTAAQYL